MGPKIFNSLPHHIREVTKCSIGQFKNKLDSFLKKVPDEPLIPGYTQYRHCETNNLIDWLGNAHLRAVMEGSAPEASRTDECRDNGGCPQ